MSVYYVIEMKAFAFETEDEATTFADMMIDAVCELEEAQDVAFSTSVKTRDDED